MVFSPGLNQCNATDLCSINSGTSLTLKCNHLIYSSMLMHKVPWRKEYMKKNCDASVRTRSPKLKLVASKKTVEVFRKNPCSKD